MNLTTAMRHIWIAKASSRPVHPSLLIQHYFTLSPPSAISFEWDPACQR